MPSPSATPAVKGPLASALAQAQEEVRRSPDDHAAGLQLARLYFANSFPEQAGQILQTLAEDPQLGARASYYLAQIADQAGDVAGRNRWLKQTLRLDATYAPAHVLIAEMLFKSGDTNAAVTAYEAALRLVPDSPEALIGLARLRLQAGDKSGAETLLEKLTGPRPGPSTGLMLLAKIREDKGDLKQAAIFRRQARQFKDPPMADPWMDEVMDFCYDFSRLSLRFEDYVKSGRQDEALACLRQLERIDPDHWMVCQMRALAAVQRGQPDEAIREYQRALRAKGDPAQIYPALLAGLVALGRLAEADIQATFALQAGPASPAILVAVAELRMKQQRAADGRELVQQALKLEPQNAQANRQMALLLWDAGHKEQASEHLETARRLLPADAPVRVLLAQYHLERNEPQAAEPPLREAIQIDPDNPEANDLMAMTHLRIGNREARAGRLREALQNYDLAIAARPALAEAYANKIQVCLQLKDYALAEEAMLRLAALRPANAAIYVSLGDIQNSAGKGAAARASWRRAMELLGDKDDELRQALLARLQANTTP